MLDKSVLMAGVLGLVFASVGWAGVLYVDGSCGSDAWNGTDSDCVAPDGPKATIQAAIDIATNGDEIVVHSGTYHETIDFSTKQIVLRSTDPASTIIDGDLDGNPNTHEGPTVTIAGGQGRETVLSGFTIIGGSGRQEDWLYRGGGVFCDASSPKLIHLRIHDNHPDFGGGTFCRDGAPLIAYSIISDNTASHAGGGIQCVRCPDALILSNLVIDNTTGNSTGGGIDLYDCGAGPRIANNTIVGNASPAQEGGGICFELSSPQIHNNIVAFNSNWGIAGRGGATGTIDYNDVWGNIGGDYWGGASPGPSDISADPLFVDRPGGDYHLDPNSPCINVGDNTGAIVFADVTTTYGSVMTIVVADASKYAIGDEIDYGDSGVLRTVTNVDLGWNTLTLAEPLCDYSTGNKPVSNYGWGDLDGDDRVLFGAVDMGAQELHDATGWDRVHNLTSDTWYNSIQDAIDGAMEGDEIVATPGVYAGSIDFAGKDIILRSVDPSDCEVVTLTVVGLGIYGGVYMEAGTLRGFTVRGGDTGITAAGTAVVTENIIRNNYSTGYGPPAAVHASGQAVVARNRITNNLAGWGEAVGAFDNAVIAENVIMENDTNPGAVFATDDSVIERNVIVGNVSDSNGGGIFARGRALIRSNLIADNYAYSPQGGGGVDANESAIVIGNTIIRNRAQGGAQGARLYGNVVFVDNVVAYNGRGGYYSIYNGIYGVGALSDYNCVFRNGTPRAVYEAGFYLEYAEGAIPGVNDINILPVLTPDYHLRMGSSCIGAGDPNRDYGGHSDIDDELRMLGLPIDIGMDEFIDSDGDGLPDWWETRYFGDPNAAVATADDDADGLINLEEYEFFGGVANTPPIFVDAATGDDAYDGRAEVWDGQHGPKETIQGALDVASDGDTVLVLPGTYSGDGNMELRYRTRSVAVVARDGPDVTTIDCQGLGRAIGPVTYSRGVRLGLIGFTITGGSADEGGGFYGDPSVMLSRCRLSGNEAANGGGGFYHTSYDPMGLKIHDVTLGTNSAPAGDAGLVSLGIVDLEGELLLSAGTLESRSSWFDGPGRIVLAEGTTLKVSGEVPSDPPTIIRSDIAGEGDIHVEAGHQLTLGGDAVVDLSGDGICNPDPNDPSGGTLLIDGSLVVQDNATVQNTNVRVRLLDLETGEEIVNNNITLLEASTGYGGEFFVQGNAHIVCNTITSEGDRYLDLDADPQAAQRPYISQNRIYVKIKQGASGSQGTLLELRALDSDCGGAANPSCESGAFAAPGSTGFTADPSENWVLERLEILADAKLNLTNRQGFEFSLWEDPNNPYPDTVYVRQLMLHPGAVLNTAFQTLYYESLVDESGSELVRDPNDLQGLLANGSRIIDVPLLGFSLGIIAMDDTTDPPHNEFDIRVRRRLRDPADQQPCTCDGTCGPADLSTCLEGSIRRLSDAEVQQEISGLAVGGVMDMRTRDPNAQSASSVAAKGAFSRAGDEDITVIFNYLFLDDGYADDAELVVYLSDDPDVSQALVEVARVRPPMVGRSGSVGSDRMATFFGTFDRGSLNFTRGTYVELELRGKGARCWIDDWDPLVACIDICGNYDGMPGVSEVDYLYLLAEYGLAGPDDYGKHCLDLITDGYVDLSDLLSWDLALDRPCWSLCPGDAPAGGQAAGSALPPAEGPLGEGQWTRGLLVAGKPRDETKGYQNDVRYTVSLTGDCTGDRMLPDPNDPQARGYGRLITDGLNRVYQLHATKGLIRLEDGQLVLFPQGGLSYQDKTISVGVTGDDGLPLLDAGFSPSDPNTLYVVPVLVSGGGVDCPYKAAARVSLQGAGACQVEALYGQDPLTDPLVTVTPVEGCKVVLEPDVQQVREVEVDGVGYVYVLSAQDLNENSWLLIYEPGGTERRILLTASPQGADQVVGPPSPSCLLFSSHDDRLYLAGSAGYSQDVPRTQLYVYHFDRATGAISLEDQIALAYPLPQEGDPFGLGYVAAVTSIQQDACGSLYVIGFTMPRFPEDYLPEEDDPYFWEDRPIFTTPTLAVVPSDGGPAVTQNLICHDLALPLSAVVVGDMGSPVNLVASEPAAGGTLPKMQNNILVCVFDAPITLPPSGEPLIITELTDPNSDVSALFSYSIDPNDTGDPTGATLKATENGEALANQTWYRVCPAPLFDVCPFTLEVCTLRGDANSSGRVTTSDYSEVKYRLGDRNDSRYDLNGSGRVTTADYSVVKAYLGVRAPDKS